MPELKRVKRVPLGIVSRHTYEAFDINGSTDFQLSSGTWNLYSSKTGSSVDNGTIGANNADSDRAGNTIKTFNFNIDLSTTDGAGLETGPYYVVVGITLVSGQKDRFRIPLYLIDFELSGVD